MFYFRRRRTNLSKSERSSGAALDRLKWRLRVPGHVHAHPPEEVTSKNPLEVDPREAEREPGDVDAMWRSVVRLYQTGLHPAIQLCVRRRGKVVLDRAIGHLRGNAPDAPYGAAKIPVRYDSLFNLYSASKAITAMMIHL